VKKVPVILHGYSVMATPFGDSRLIASLPPLLCLLCQSARVSADDYFDPAALEFASPQQKMADLHYFAKSGGQQPGVYSVNIWVNNQDAGQGPSPLWRKMGHCSRF
jgi:outer membrane usher protein